MTERAGESGPVLQDTTQTVVVPNITDGDTADVALTADAQFAGSGSLAKGVLATFAGVPLANLGIVGAWVSNTVTGVVTIRFSALTGNVATANQAVRVRRA